MQHSNASVLQHLVYFLFLLSVTWGGARKRDKIELPQVYRHCTARAGIDVKTHLLEEFKELGLVKFNTCKRIKHGSHIGNLSGKSGQGKEEEGGKEGKRKEKGECVSAG